MKEDCADWEKAKVKEESPSVVVFFESSKASFKSAFFTRLFLNVREIAEPASRGPLALVTQTPSIVANVTLVVPNLRFDIRKLIRKWWNGEITGADCVAGMLLFGVAAVAGLVVVAAGFVGGAAIGATAGTAVLGPIGAIVGAISGAVIGAFVGGITAEIIAGLLLGWFYSKPQREALSDSYTFLGVSEEATNSEINSRFRHLAMQYHPDRPGGDPKMWAKLQHAMAIIRVARGEI